MPPAQGEVPVEFTAPVSTRTKDAIKTTIQWFKDHQDWWRAIKSGEYLKYYEQQYAGR